MKYTSIILSIIILCALVTLSIHQYETRPRPKPGETVQQALNAEASAKKTMAEHDAVNLVTLSNADRQISLLTAQKSTLCTQIKAAKLPQPLCN